MEEKKKKKPGGGGGGGRKGVVIDNVRKFITLPQHASGSQC